MAGGGGAKKLIVNMLVDKPAQCYVGGGFVIWAYRKYSIHQQYSTWFGKFDFQRKVERG